MEIHMIGHENKKCEDEMHFLIEYLSELTFEGFSDKEICSILMHATGSLMEYMDLPDRLRMTYYSLSERVFHSAQEYRQEHGEYQEEE